MMTPCAYAKPLVNWPIGLAAFVALAFVSSAAHADVAPPEPPTFWGKNQAPDKIHVLIAGICISAAIVAGGLLVAWQVGFKSRTGKIGLTVFGVMLVAAALVTVALPLRIHWENQQWQEWDRRDASRRNRQPLDWPKEPEPEPPKRIKTSSDQDAPKVGKTGGTQPSAP
jgi:hypothetical protein